MNIGKCVCIVILCIILFAIIKCSYSKLSPSQKSDNSINIEYIYEDRYRTYHTKLKCVAMFLTTVDSLNINYDMGVLRVKYIANIDSSYFCSMCVSDDIYKYIKENFALQNNKISDSSFASEKCTENKP